MTLFSRASNEGYLGERVLDALLDLIADGSFSVASRNAIENADALDLLLLVSRLFEPKSTQRRLYTTLVIIFESSPRNRSIACERHVIYRLLEVSFLRNMLVSN